MGRRVKPSEVLVPNVLARDSLDSEVIGVYRPTSADGWSEFELDNEPEPGEEKAEVPAGSAIMLEPLGAEPELRFRVRKGRKVLRLRWVPTTEDREALASGKWGVRESEQATLFEKIFGLGPKDDPRDDMLEYFLDVKVRPVESGAGIGYTAMIVRMLRGR
jgi:hypothetical protein